MKYHSYSQMTEPRAWRAKVTETLQQAEAARVRGNEGMARVCARRAAGWAIQAYLERKGVDLKTTSVLAQIRYLLANKPDPELRPILEHMLQPKVRPIFEKESYFPLDVDLIAEARQLIDLLFPNQKNPTNDH